MEGVTFFFDFVGTCLCSDPPPPSSPLSPKSTFISLSYISISLGPVLRPECTENCLNKKGFL